MTDARSIHDAYWDAFVGSDPSLGVPICEVCPPQFLYDPRMLRMMEEALASGVAVTAADVHRVFGEDIWDEVVVEA